MNERIAKTHWIEPDEAMARLEGSKRGGLYACECGYMASEAFDACGRCGKVKPATKPDAFDEALDEYGSCLGHAERLREQMLHTDEDYDRSAVRMIEKAEVARQRLRDLRDREHKLREGNARVAKRVAAEHDSLYTEDEVREMLVQAAHEGYERDMTDGDADTDNDIADRILAEGKKE
jgi:hypothetical protein